MKSAKYLSIFVCGAGAFPIQLTGIKTKEKSIGQDQQDRQDAILVANHDTRNERRGVSQNNMSVLSETADKRRCTQI